MIKELTKKYLRNNTTIVRVCPGDSIYDVEWLLIDTYKCYYWNNGDYHRDTQWHIGDKFEHDQYFIVSYVNREDILILNMGAFWNTDDEKNANVISSRMLFREKKIKKLIKKCSKLETR